MVKWGPPIAGFLPRSPSRRWQAIPVPMKAMGGCMAFVMMAAAGLLCWRPQVCPVRLSRPLTASPRATGPLAQPHVSVATQAARALWQLLLVQIQQLRGSSQRTLWFMAIAPDDSAQPCRTLADCPRAVQRANSMHDEYASYGALGRLGSLHSAPSSTACCGVDAEGSAILSPHPRCACAPVARRALKPQCKSRSCQPGSTRRTCCRCSCTRARCRPG